MSCGACSTSPGSSVGPRTASGQHAEGPTAGPQYLDLSDHLPQAVQRLRTSQQQGWSLLVERDLELLCVPKFEVDLEFSGGVSESGIVDVAVNVSVDGGQRGT